MKYVILALTLALQIFSVWFTVVGVFAVFRAKKIPASSPKTRFACLIAARNEQNVITEIINSLRSQNYPDDLYDIFVIPNNCTDETELRARAAGAHIINCPSGVRCKGDALRVAMAHLADKPYNVYDVYCVFDADNEVDPGFLAAMNNAFCAGARVAKGAIKVKNPYDSAVSGCYGMYFALFDTFFSRPRMTLGLSSKLVGTGFAVRREVIEDLGGWNTQTIAEDAEFSAMCVTRGERVWFVRDAVTRDEAPRDFRTTMIQRRRWCSGLMDVAKVRLGDLVASFFKKPTFKKWDMMAFLCYPFTYVLSLIPAAMSAVDAAVRGEFLSFIIIMCARLALAYVCCAAVGVLLARLGGMKIGRALPAVLMFPIFMASWLPLQVVSFFRRERRWRPIAHGIVNTK